jgi:hypothetical protein
MAVEAKREPGERSWASDMNEWGGEEVGGECGRGIGWQMDLAYGGFEAFRL